MRFKAGILLLCVLGLVGWQGRTPLPSEQADGLYAEIQTSKGLIVIQLYPDKAPIAVANFVGLAEGTIANAAFDLGRPYFDGTTFHRVVPGHVIQAGIPKSDRAQGPGYTFPNEIDARLSHNHAGAVNMANGGPNTNASQWCIMLGDRSYLDGDYTVFGDTVQGLDVVMKIVQGDTVDSVRIVRVGAQAQAYHPTTASFQAMVAAAKQRVIEQAKLKAAAEQAWIAQNYPKATGPAGGVLTQTISEAKATLPPDTPLRVRYSGRIVRYVGDWQGRSGPPLETIAFGSGPNGVPGYIDPPQPFTYEPGKTRLNPGLDSVLTTMQPGDHRIVIVPAASGYGRAGLYPPETPGQKRFVISPNVLLVYDVEVLAN